MQRYKLRATVRLEDGSVIREVIIRRPTADDLSITRLAVASEIERRGGAALSLPLLSTHLIAQLIDLPIATVRKFAASDCQQLHDLCARAYEEAGIE